MSPRPRWADVLDASMVAVLATPALVAIFPAARIRLAGTAEHAVPCLEASLIGDSQTELWHPCTVQWDIFTQTLEDQLTAEHWLKALFHLELPLAIAGVGMWSEYVDGSILATPSRDNYFGRAIRFRQTPLREIYDRSRPT